MRRQRRERKVDGSDVNSHDMTSSSDNLMGESSIPTEPIIAIDNTVGNDSIDISSNSGAARHTNNRRRHPSRYHMMCITIYTMAITNLTFANAFNIAMFSTRIGIKPSANRILGRSNRYQSTISNQLQNTNLVRSRNIAFTSLKMSDMDVQSQQTEQSNVADEDEWRTVLAAFQMYKAAYGDLKVPSRFIVPGMAPWPESAWKMKLGQRVAAIRSTGKYVQNSETRRKMLDDMGFLWRLRSPSTGKKLDGIAFEQVYDALKMYRDQVQPAGTKLEVPPNFVVPDCEPWPDSTRGLPLGKIMPTVRSKAYLKQHPDAEGKLSSLGYHADVKTAANDLRYQRVYDALVRYKELYGDLLVPQPFTIPEDGDEWPKEVQGLRLGARVNAIRSQGTFVKTNPARKEELDTLGFVWELPTNAEGSRRGRKRKDEMDGEGGESEEDGSPMGSMFGSDSTSAFDTTRDPFFTGDQSSPPQWAFEGEDDEEALMEQEKDDNKYAEPKSFNETLDEMADMAMSIGIMERWTPNKRVVKGARNKFVPWRNDDFGSDFVFEDVVEALVLYKELYEDFESIEEDDFTVPAPVEESLRLSPFELAAMNADSPDDLEDIDGPWSEDEDDESLESKFSVVASNDWPEHLAGMRLGQIVSRIREGGLEVKHLPERKARLDEIGFDWGDPKRFVDVPFEKVMCALYAYYMIRGDTFVRPTFVMPDEQPWPTILAGYELGAAVTRLRELQNFLEAYHPVKMSLLRMVDFSFFPELALPLDPDAAEMNMEHLYVETFGHPLYHISTVPLGLPEKMLADGPDGPPEKLSSWYNYEYVREFHERPGTLTDVADWMRMIGFYQLAEEHEQKYGQSHYRQLFLLKDKLDNKEISQEIWDEEIDRIKDEVLSDFEQWQEKENNGQSKGITDGEYDYSVSEEDYYFMTLESEQSQIDRSMISQPPPPQLINGASLDVVEEEIEEFSLDGGD